MYFYNKTKNEKYLEPVNLILKHFVPKGIYDHVEGGIARYTTDENWIIPHFEKMLYDNTQFILLCQSFVKLIKKPIIKIKLEQTIEFLKKEFLKIKRDF